MPAPAPLLLLIEDELPIRRFLRSSLGVEGYRLEEAETGEKALRMAARQPPDLVLLVFIGFVLLFALLISYPWEVLTIATILYLASLPFGWLSYRAHARRDSRALLTGKVEAGVNLDRPSAVVPFESVADARERQTRH